MKRHVSPTFALLLRDFFCDRLIKQQHVSPHTVASFRDTFRLLLAFLGKKRRQAPEVLTFDDLDADSVLAFLDHLEQQRDNSVRTRNVRLTALRAFATYASSRDPTLLWWAQRIRAIPSKRFHRPLLGYLTRVEIEALLNAPNPADWSGRRDRALFTLIYNTGARVSEAINLSRADVRIGPSPALQIRGKGRKDRSVPLWKASMVLLTAWFTEIAPAAQTPLFPNRHGRPLSRSGVEERLERAVSVASVHCPSLGAKNISPHTLRHTTAMHLLQAGVDITVIALWLGHESTETTHQYVEADLEMKRHVLDQLDEPIIQKQRTPKANDLLDFLDGL